MELLAIGISIFAALAFGLYFIWDQRRIGKMRSTLQFDPEKQIYSWQDLDGQIKTSKINPAKRHTDDEVGGEWGDGSGPDPQS